MTNNLIRKCVKTGDSFRAVIDLNISYIQFLTNRIMRLKAKPQNLGGKSNLLLIFFGVLSLFCGNLNAQNNTSSLYSRYGIGELTESVGSQNFAMGGTSIGLRTPAHINFGNPASHTTYSPRSFIFDVGFKYRQTTMESTDAMRTTHDANISYLAMAFPVTSWWGTSIGMRPISSVGYNLTVEDETVGSEHTLISNYEGSGGIREVYWANAIRPFAALKSSSLSNLSIGANLSYMYGSLDSKTTTTYRSMFSSSLLIDENRLVIDGFTYSLGAQFSDTICKSECRKKYTAKNNKIYTNDFIYTVGLTFSNKQKLDAFSSRSFVNHLNVNGYAYSQVIDSTESEPADIELPKSLGIGFSLRNGNKWAVAADYRQENWEGLAFFGDELQEYANSSRMSVGAEITPRWNSYRYWQVIRYRVGAYMSNYYLKFGDEQLKDLGVSIGFGLPLPNSRTSFNLGFNFGFRGTTNNDLMKETYGAFTLNISFHQSWFYQRKFN